MATPILIDPVGFGLELQEQLASGARCVGFLFGAGSSISSGLPDLAKLTKAVAERLEPEQRKSFEAIRGTDGNLETVLNHIRALREILSPAETFHGLTSATAISLDAAMCNAVYQIIAAGDPKPSRAHINLATWVQQSQHSLPVEIFTTNYDLLLEAAFELTGLPYFDGFVGAVRPFFVPQAVDPLNQSDAELNVPPPTWARLWKLHGSVGWRFYSDAGSGQKRIIRVAGEQPKAGEEVVVYPSREKYSESRRLPYLTYMDRLRRFLASGERILLICGYSFGDEHINEVLEQGLQSNTRLTIHCFFFDSIPEAAERMASYHPNLTAVGPKQIMLGGERQDWSRPSRKPEPGEQWHFWDDTNSSFALGDFGAFGSFLGGMSGVQAKPQAATPVQTTVGQQVSTTP